MPPMMILAAVLVAITALTQASTAHVRLPHSILLVIVGALLSVVPGLTAVTVDPDVVLLLFLPPLLYSSGVNMSWRGFRSNLRPILLLAVGCVLFTAGAVAAVGHVLLGLPWSVAFVLGAVVSPPDAVAPMAIARRLSLPRRLLTVLEGEGLVNDATALILFSFAVGAVAAGDFSPGSAVTSFAAIVAGELLWGVAAGWGMLQLRYRVSDPQVEIMLALLTPFLAFWPPHALGGSGVLAAVAAGLYVSWNGRRFITAPTRLQGFFVWNLVVHIVEGLLFLLTGLQARAIVTGIEGDWRRVAAAAVTVCLAVILVRFLWVFPATHVSRWVSPSLRQRQPAPPWRQLFFIGFTGIRGVVSLAAALSIPYTVGGAPFPDRALILFVTFSVIVVTLVGQGTVLPRLIGWLGLADAGAAERAEDKREEIAARIAGVDAALAELDRRAEGVRDTAVAALRRRHEDRRAELCGTIDEHVEGSPLADDGALQVHLIDAERRRIAEIYDANKLTDDARRRIEREFDLEDARNRHAIESATGDTLSDPEQERLDE